MARSDVLVSTEWAENNLDTAGVVFVEVDENTSAYDDEGHIPGAVKLDWQTDLWHPVERDFIGPDGKTYNAGTGTDTRGQSNGQGHSVDQGNRGTWQGLITSGMDG